MIFFKPFFDFMIQLITHLDKEALTPLKKHTGKVIGIEFLEFSKTLHFKILDNKIEWIGQLEVDQMVHTVISGQLKDFITLWASPNASVNTKIHIHGDMALAEAFHTLFRNLDFDWEEKLAYVLGDTLAFQLSEVAKSSHAWSKEFVSNRAEDLTEYLQFEKQCLPCQTEVDDFCKAVDKIRDDTERVAARIEQLKKRLASTS